MASIAVHTQGLSRRFDHHSALRDVSLTLAAGSVLLLVGPNGAGKTTLLRILATALRPTGGRAAVFGHDVVHEADAVRRHVVYVGTAHGMYEAMTARENLAFAAAMSGRPDRGAAVLDRVGLRAVADAPLRAFSHGMKRRLALARAWMLAPRLLLLDDPFGGLDAEGVTLVDDMVDEVRTRGGCAILATHEWERGLHLADVVVGLIGGRLVQTAPAAEVSAPRMAALAGGRA